MMENLKVICTCYCRLVDVAVELFAMEPEIQKLKIKAAETHPDRRVYGPGMVDKVCPHQKGHSDFLCTLWKREHC